MSDANEKWLVEVLKEGKRAKELRFDGSAAMLLVRLDEKHVRPIAEQRVDPAFRAVPVGYVVVEEQLAEQDSGADVGERPEGEDPVRRLDLGRQGRVLANDAIDDSADRLVHEWNPQLVEVGHAWIMAGPAYP